MPRSYVENVGWLSFPLEQEVGLETVYKMLLSGLELDWAFIFYKNSRFFCLFFSFEDVTLNSSKSYLKIISELQNSRVYTLLESLSCIHLFLYLSKDILGCIEINTYILRRPLYCMSDSSQLQSSILPFLAVLEDCLLV